MDISVERLNNRLAMRLPAELPLGLVFVSGTLVELESRSGGADRSAVQFTLEEGGYRLRCVLQDASRSEAELHRGALVRAGGHLAFDALEADYVLLARDVEIVGEIDLPPEDDIILELGGLDSMTATPLLAELNRRAAVYGLSPAEVPSWVAALAPAAVKAEMVTAGTSQPVARSAAQSPDAPPLNAELVAAISAALEQGEDVELTREFLRQYVPVEPAPAGGAGAVSSAKAKQAAATTAVAAANQPASSPRANNRGSGWILALLMLNLVFLTIVVAAIVYVLFF